MVAHIPRAATALALAIAILAGPLALARCAAACETAPGRVALKLPPCHHHGHHGAASAIVVPTAAAGVVAIAIPTQTLQLTTITRALTAERAVSPPRSFSRPLRI